MYIFFGKRDFLVETVNDDGAGWWGVGVSEYIVSRSALITFCCCKMHFTNYQKIEVKNHIFVIHNSMRTWLSPTDSGKVQQLC